MTSLNQLAMGLETKITEQNQKSLEREQVFRLQLHAEQQQTHRLQQEKAQHEQELAAQLLIFHQQARIEKAELIQQHRIDLQVLQDQYSKSELAFSRQLLEIQQLREEQRDEKSREYAKREQAQLEQLTQVRQHLEIQLSQRVDREQVFSQQLQSIQQAREQQRESQGREYEEHIEKLNSELVGKHDQINRLFIDNKEAEKMLLASLADLRQEIDFMRGSSSWRWSAPFRGLASLLSKNRSDKSNITHAVLINTPGNTRATSEVAQAPAEPQLSSPSLYYTNIRTFDMGLSDMNIPVTTLDELLSHYDERFIYSAYQALLGRVPDADGMHYYLTRVRAGVDKLEILGQLRRSVEGRSRKVTVVGLDQAIKNYRLSKTLFIGSLINLIRFQKSNNIILAKLNSLNNRAYVIDENTRILNKNLEIGINIIQEKLKNFDEKTIAETTDIGSSCSAIDLLPNERAKPGMYVTPSIKPLIAGANDSKLHLAAKKSALSVSLPEGWPQVQANASQTAEMIASLQERSRCEFVNGAEFKAESRVHCPYKRLQVGEIVEQYFMLSDQVLSSITLYFFTYMKKNGARICVNLYVLLPDCVEHQLFNQCFDGDDINDGDAVNVVIDPTILSASGQIFRIEIILQALDASADITVAINKSKEYCLRTIDVGEAANYALSFGVNRISKVLPDTSREVTRHKQLVSIVVCVHNALDDVKQCLESIMRHTLPPYHLIIVDDGSNQDTKEFLEKFTTGQPVTLIRNDVASGYTKAANTGMRASNGEFVVLLNSDTLVSPYWLDRLIMCANSSAQIGMVGPLSNTASWQSVPKIWNDQGDWADNPLPYNWSVQDYANEVARQSPRIYPRVGFLNGFCLLIKRQLIDDIGLFDEVTFARGYGEENDYCLFATEKKWQLVVADDCYVFHAQSKSYSHERRAELSTLAGEALAKKHGQERIDDNLALTMPHLALAYLRQRSASIECLLSLRTQFQQRFEGKRVLFLLPALSAGGGSNIILLEAAWLRSLGVDVWIANLEGNRHSFEQSYSNLQVPVLYLRAPESLIDLASDFDAVVATLYLTVYWMAPLQKLENCPVLGYYVQDFEPDFFEKGSAEYESALRSYTALPKIKLFTKTNWNRDALQNNANVTATVVGHSFDIDRFHPSMSAPTEDGCVKILAMVRPSTPRRAPAATMRILRQLALHFGARVKITIFGVESSDAELLTYPTDFIYKNLGEIDSQGVAFALSNSDIFLDCSIFQAMGLTAMEAMASGVAVIGPINGGLKEIIVHGHSGMLVDTRYDDKIFDAAAKLITDGELRKTIQLNALDVLNNSPGFSCFKIMDCLFANTSQGSGIAQVTRSGVPHNVL
jgi:GT2 family glycosyltransferase/glycosyltransferase involved in cell wall biosynthesis